MAMGDVASYSEEFPRVRVAGVYGAPVPDTGSGTVEWHLSTAESSFVRAEVRDLRGHMAALGNPVLLA